MPYYIWYAITPNHWIKCIEMHQTIAGVTVTLYTGKIEVNLRKRQINGATIVQ